MVGSLGKKTLSSMAKAGPQSKVPYSMVANHPKYSLNVHCKFNHI